MGYINRLDKVWQIGLISILFGFNYFSQASYYVLYGAQIAFPVDQASVAGYLISISNTFGFILGLIMVAIYDGNSSSAIMEISIMGAIALIGVFLTWTVD